MQPRVPAARERRLARLAAGGPRAGLTRAASTLALAGGGLRVAGEVMGAVSLRVPSQGFFYRPGDRTRYPRGWQGTDDAPPPVFTSGTHSQTPTWVSAIRTGHRRTLSRLLEEAMALGADGVVDVRLQHVIEEDGELGELGAPVWEFLATGTAVVSAGPTRAQRPFTSTLSATGTLNALDRGWVPVTVLSCPVMAVRGVGAPSQGQLRWRGPNGGLEAHTETVLAARREAAADFAREARRVGADAAVTTSSTVEHRPARDLAEVSVLLLGTALAAFDAGGAVPAPRTVVDLGVGRTT